MTTSLSNLLGRGFVALLLVTSSAAAQETPAEATAPPAPAEAQPTAPSAAEEAPPSPPAEAAPSPATAQPSPAVAADEPQAADATVAEDGQRRKKFKLKPADEGPPSQNEGPAGEPEPASTDEAKAKKHGHKPIPDWLDDFTLGGGAIVYYYQPTEGGPGNVSLFFANLILDGKWGHFGLHVEPRFRDTKLRPFFEGPVWVQEVYGSFTLDPVTLKLGKIYKQNAGLFWDNSFYGNVQVYDGLKLDPNYGASLESTIGDKLGVFLAAQYFVVDGRTNVSLQGRDTISIPDARRRNTLVGRVSPFVKFGDGEFRLGGGIEHFDADIPDQKEDVTRLGADAKFTYGFGDLGGVGVWGEYTHQSGRHVVDHPVAGAASGDNHYFQVGGEVSIWRFTARYNVSHAIYADADTTEWLHVPALGFKANDNLSLLGEFVVWRQTTAGETIPYDTSLNVTLHGQL